MATALAWHANGAGHALQTRGMEHMRAGCVCLRVEQTKGVACSSVHSLSVAGHLLAYVHNKVLLFN